MAEAGVADFEGDGGDVHLAFAQEGSGAFEADIAEVAGDGFAHFLRENTSQMKVAAADAAAHFLEGWRLGHLGAKNGGNFFDALLIQLLLALAEKAVVGRAEKQSGGHFEGLGAIPKRGGGVRDGRMAQSQQGLTLFAGEPGAFGDGGFDTAAAKGEFAQARVEGRRDQEQALRGEKGPGEFHGEELVTLAGAARAFQAGFFLRVKSYG